MGKEDLTEKGRLLFFLPFYTTPVLIRRKLDKQVDGEERSEKKRDRKRRIKGLFCNLMSCVHDALCIKTVVLAKGTRSTKIIKKKCEHNITK